ncbi:MAG TPA: MazG nucleotide pyrophosphohydrolase domain-containing protein [Patescibacteria group bacterium]|nr:MazG nucleotide pyrophosphohydrolase domain-containing protein [Patescibacteria group bacterium]
MAKKQQISPFGKYFTHLDNIDKELKTSDEYGSILILNLVEEVGEMARAYLAKHGRKGTNLAAQQDETYQQELGDILVAIIRFARIKNINLDQRIMYTLRKIERRKKNPKQPKS